MGFFKLTVTCFYTVFHEIILMTLFQGPSLSQFPSSGGMGLEGPMGRLTVQVQ